MFLLNKRKRKKDTLNNNIQILYYPKEHKYNYVIIELSCICCNCVIKTINKINKKREGFRGSHHHEKCPSCFKQQPDFNEIINSQKEQYKNYSDKKTKKTYRNAFHQVKGFYEYYVSKGDKYEEYAKNLPKIPDNLEFIENSK